MRIVSEEEDDVDILDAIDHASVEGDPITLLVDLRLGHLNVMVCP